MALYSSTTHRILVLIVSFILASSLHAQVSVMSDTIEEISLIAPRILTSLPWTYTKDTLSNFDVFQNNMRGALDRKVGVQATNGENFAQDVRITIRGFGSRSAFGVRGIRLYLDGVPLTSPDGTSQLDEVSIFDISTVEVIRSGLSASLGNSGGGTIAFTSPNLSKNNQSVHLLSRYNSLGSYDLGGKIFSKGKLLQNMLSVNHHSFKGQRELSEAKTTSVYNKLLFQPYTNWSLTWILGYYNSPRGDDPGALTMEQFVVNPYQANTRNLQYQAGESVKGGLLSTQSLWQISKYIDVSTSFFTKKRNFEGNLPFENNGSVMLNRDFSGLMNVITCRVNKDNDLVFGQSFEYQLDRRQLFSNLDGDRGLLGADQLESVKNFSLSEQWRFSHQNVSIHQLLRYDAFNYRLKDYYDSDGIQEGNKQFQTINGALGLEWHVSNKANVYSNMSTSFEMPTLNELTNNPNGLSDFNPSLNPEKSFQVELGMKTNKNATIRWGLAAYRIALRDQIQSYQIDDIVSKTYFRNAAKSERLGFDLSFDSKVSNLLHLSANYSFTHYRYVLYVDGAQDYSGNYQPLIPKHKVNLKLDISAIRIIDASISASFSSPVWLNDANTVKVSNLGDVNVLVQTNELFSKNISIGFNIHNMFNTLKYSNFRANAAGNRFFEAASRRNVSFYVKYFI